MNIGIDLICPYNIVDICKRWSLTLHQNLRKPATKSDVEPQCKHIKSGSWGVGGGGAGKLHSVVSPKHPEQLADV